MPLSSPGAALCMWGMVSHFLPCRLLCPRPVGGELSGHRRPSSICLMSRTSALTRKPKGLGRRNFAQGYPRYSHTDFKVKRSNVKVTGSISAPQRNVPIFRYALQIWYAHRPWAVLATDHKLAPKWVWPGVRDPISKFWDPLNISQTGKATIFKFGTHGRGHIVTAT